MYWVGVEEPKERSKIIASIEGQTIEVHETDVQRITFYLNDALLDLDRPVYIRYQGQELGSFQRIPRTLQTIHDTLRDSYDWYSASVTVDLP